MKGKPRNRSQQKQINILHTTTRQRHSKKQVTRTAAWISFGVVVLAAVVFGLHFGFSLLLDRALYHNPRYTLNKIDIEPAGHFTGYTIRQAAGVELGENLWTLDLPRIAHNLEKLPYVSSAKVERHFPDRIVIRITERQPMVKIVGINVDLGTRETFYLDHECVVLKPRPDEPPFTPPLPEIIGLTNAELEPGVRLEQPALARALEIIEAIKHASLLNTSIDIRSVDLSQALCIKMVTTRDTVIIFRPDHINEQLIRLETIFERYDNGTRTLRTVDLTPEQNVPVTFYE